MINTNIKSNLIYHIFRTIKQKFRIYRFKKRIRVIKPLKIVIGASGIFESGWIPADIDFLNLLKESDWKKFFVENQIDAILAEHVWEHLTIEEALIAAKMCYKYLNVGGYIRLAVPDGLHPNSEYINLVKPGGTGFGSDDHKILYTYKVLSETFESAGFKVNLLEYFDENGKFICNEWDTKKGLIRRSKRFDRRNKDGNLNYTSIILDAIK